MAVIKRRAISQRSHEKIGDCEQSKKLTVDVLQNCPVAPHFTSTASLLDCPSTRIMQVRVHGQSSSDTVKKNRSH